MPLGENPPLTETTGKPARMPGSVTKVAPSAPLLTTYKSALEVRSTGKIRGWVYNPLDASEKIRVRLFIEDVEVAQAIADEAEPKLNIEDKNHRFWLVIPDRFHDGQRHKFHVVIGETDQTVKQSDPVFLLPAKVDAEASHLSGSVAFKSGSLRGHALDVRELRDKHVVSLSIDGRLVGVALADEIKEGIEDARQGHFFSFPIPIEYWDGFPHTFAAVVDGSETPLDTAREAFTIPALSGVVGEVDNIGDGVVSGWVADIANPDGKTNILLRIDGSVSVRADAILKYAPLTLASGVVVPRRGFSLPLPDDIFDGARHEIIVHVGDKTKTARNLCGTTFRLTRQSGRNAVTRESAARNHRALVEAEVVYDIVFVLNINSKGWILEKICRIISDELGLNAYFTFTEKNGALTGWLPRARSYFFGHYKLLAGALKSGADVGDAARFVWFTHPVFDASFTRENLYTTLAAAHHVFTANSKHEDALAFLGLEPRKITTVLGGADPAEFAFKTRKARGVGVVGAYYRRKNPDLMLELACAMPDTPFLLLAPMASEVENKLLLWSHWPRLAEFQALPNTRYIEAAYEDFPRYFAEFDVYLSVSELEGGPIPLIEAMFANSVPVVTRTGFAEDLIVDGANGYLVPIGVGVDILVEKVRLACANQADVRATVANFTWRGFGSSIAEIIAPRPLAGQAIQLGLGHGSEMRLREGWVRQDLLGAIMDGAVARLCMPIDGPITAVTLCADYESSCPATIELSIDRMPIARHELQPGSQTLRFELTSERQVGSARSNITLAVESKGAAETRDKSLLRVRSLTFDGAET